METVRLPDRGDPRDDAGDEPADKHVPSTIAGAVKDEPRAGPSLAWWPGSHGIAGLARAAPLRGPLYVAPLYKTQSWQR